MPHRGTSQPGTTGPCTFSVAKSRFNTFIINSLQVLFKVSDVSVPAFKKGKTITSTVSEAVLRVPGRHLEVMPKFPFRLLLWGVIPGSPGGSQLGRPFRRVKPDTHTPVLSVVVSVLWIVPQNILMP